MRRDFNFPILTPNSVICIQDAGTDGPMEKEPFYAVHVGYERWWTVDSE